MKTFVRFAAATVAGLLSAGCASERTFGLYAQAAADVPSPQPQKILVTLYPLGSLTKPSAYLLETEFDETPVHELLAGSRKSRAAVALKEVPIGAADWTELSGPVTESGSEAIAAFGVVAGYELTGGLMTGKAVKAKVRVRRAELSRFEDAGNSKSKSHYAVRVKIGKDGLSFAGHESADAAGSLQYWDSNNTPFNTPFGAP